MFGQGTAFDTEINLGDLDGSNGFTLNGVEHRDLSGASVIGAGDINGDGIDDFIVGAPTYNDYSGYYDPGSGQAYVVFGQTAGFDAEVDLGSLDGSNGFVLNGENAYDNAGQSVSGAGDVNGDGFDDLLIGAPDADPNGERSGQSYVVFGKGAGFDAQISLGDLDGSNGFVLNGINSGDNAGRSVSSAGDFNGDGFDDVIVGAPRADPNGVSSGQSYVVFGSGSDFDAELSLGDLDGSDGFVIDGVEALLAQRSGRSVSGAGDVNGDGFDDLLIGGDTSGARGGEGQTYLIFGAAGGFGGRLDLADLNGSNGFAIDGINNSDDSGASVSGAGDINNDGFDDLLIGAPYADPNGRSSGQSYVIFGGPDILAGFDAGDTATLTSLAEPELFVA